MPGLSSKKSRGVRGLKKANAPSLPSLRDADLSTLSVDDWQPPSSEMNGTHNNMRRPVRANSEAALGGIPSSRKADVPLQRLWADHLVTFPMSNETGIRDSDDGLRELRVMERNQAVWAQPVLLTLTGRAMYIDDENGDPVSRFPLLSVEQSTAFSSNNNSHNDFYNNLLVFSTRPPGAIAAVEMHLFQCYRVSAHDVVSDLKRAVGDARATAANTSPGRDGRSQGGGSPLRRRTASAFNVGLPSPAPPLSTLPPPRRTSPRSYSNHQRTASFTAAGHDQNYRNGHATGYSSAISPRDYLFEEQRDEQTHDQRANGYERSPVKVDRSGSAAGVNESCQRDVLALNHCFDEIEAFIGRLQATNAEIRKATKRKRAMLRKHMPDEAKFIDVFQKFKLSFILLAKLRDFIHDPSASELLHYLFTPLALMLEAARFQTNSNDSVAPRVLSPLLSRAAVDLLSSSVTQRERDLWMSLGEGWTTAEDAWPRAQPLPYYPVFIDGYAPYGPPLSPATTVGPLPGTLAPPISPPVHRTRSKLSLLGPRRNSQQSLTGSAYGYPPIAGVQGMQAYHQPNDHLRPLSAPLEPVRDEYIYDDRAEREQLEVEKSRLEARERRVREHERRLQEERARLSAEHRRLGRRQDVDQSTTTQSDDEHSSGEERRRSRMPDRRRDRDPQRYRSLERMRDQRQVNGAPPQLNMGTHESLAAMNVISSENSPVPGQSQSRQGVFLEDLMSRKARIVQTIHARTGANAKELTVFSGEYLELLSDTRQWWECRNVHGRVGYVPYTILQPLHASGTNVLAAAQSPLAKSPQAMNGSASMIPPAPPMPNDVKPGNSAASHIVVDEKTPNFIKERMGRKGEFKYF